MRVYVPTTWERLVGLRAVGLPAGTGGYAVTDALATALEVPGPLAAAGADILDDLADVAVDAAAEASLLLLAADAQAESPSHPQAGSSTPEPRRAVLAVEAPASPDPDDDHPAAVVLDAPATWSQVSSVVADDRSDVAAVSAALALLATGSDGDPGPAVAALAGSVLGWFDPAEVGEEPVRPE